MFVAFAGAASFLGGGPRKSSMARRGISPHSPRRLLSGGKLCSIASRFATRTECLARFRGMPTKWRWRRVPFFYICQQLQQGPKEPGQDLGHRVHSAFLAAKGRRVHACARTFAHLLHFFRQGIL